ncbi:hypothetical protein [Terrimonas alba]|uniref:hypothetical protein n=1 Tax=Terrimonas alba TaxID=3349636 RepID=UPI0035F4FD16
MILYYDLISKIPEFKSYSVFDEEDYIETGISPLGTIGSWLKELSADAIQNRKLIQKICGYLNDIFANADKFNGDIRNDFQVYLFWVLDYPTINHINIYLDPKILEDGRKYLKAIDGENYREV